MPDEIQGPIVGGLRRVITPGTGVERDFYHFTTGENLFYDYPDEAIQIGGKTGAARAPKTTRGTTGLCSRGSASMRRGTTS